MLTKKTFTSLALLSLPLAHSALLYAAKPIDLNHSGMPYFSSFNAGPASILETKRDQFRGKLHVRLQQTYAGVPVWGAEGIMHIPGGQLNQSLMALSKSPNKDRSMDGTFYLDLQKDLERTPSVALTDAQKNRAEKIAVEKYENKIQGKTALKNFKNELIVFVGKNNIAHYAYHVSFYASPTKPGEIPAKPNFIIDALTLEIYQQWDNIQTVLEQVSTFGGGFGGNIKMGKLVYDGLQDDLDKLNITRDSETKICSLENEHVKVKNCVDFWFGRCMNSVDFTIPCEETDPQHNNVYWNGDNDKVNDGFSPSNDALFNGEIINNMYMQWYGVPVLQENGRPMLLTMVVHLPMDNAYWDGETMNFGDGISLFYPLTSLGVASHEISHGFTTQHSDLSYYGQSGGMNEAFSDMAAQAAEFFAYGHNSWQIGPEIFKQADRALRYMDQPSKDCGPTRKPGNHCSIDNAEQYNDSIDVHFSSGVYNRAYYLLGTSKNWNPKKAFDVMVNANSHYWVSSTNFTQGACGAVKAAKDLGYDVKAVKRAFSGVKVSTADC